MGELYLRDNVAGTGVYMAINEWWVINTSPYTVSAPWPEKKEPSGCPSGRKVPWVWWGSTFSGLRVLRDSSTATGLGVGLRTPPWDSLCDQGLRAGRAVVGVGGQTGSRREARGGFTSPHSGHVPVPRLHASCLLAVTASREGRVLFSRCVLPDPL